MVLMPPNLSVSLYLFTSVETISRLINYLFERKLTILIIYELFCCIVIFHAKDELAPASHL